ncbi:hypothetical protein E5288_WYG009341 [Bos mutus]|uniref:Uncharacterized protein n=1 Tax=Bos mutus TaxID=72004 RepID=A0A6B0RZX6_9CETA|nr:hypothetical protein [Bos mutus]
MALKPGVVRYAVALLLDHEHPGPVLSGDQGIRRLFDLPLLKRIELGALSSGPDSLMKHLQDSGKDTRTCLQNVEEECKHWYRREREERKARAHIQRWIR